MRIASRKKKIIEKENYLEKRGKLKLKDGWELAKQLYKPNNSSSNRQNLREVERE